MGHFRLQTLPDTAPWRRVVGLIAEEGDAAAVAAATTAAATAGLDRARGDDGLAHCFWLLTRTVLASRQDDFGAALLKAGLSAGQEPSVFDIVAAFSDAVDGHLDANRRRTDL